MNIPAGYKLHRGFFEKTCTFVRGRSYGKEIVVTETIIRDSAGRLLAVVQQKPGQSAAVQRTEVRRIDSAARPTAH